MQRHVAVGSKWATIWFSVPWPNFIWHNDLNSPSCIKYFLLYIDISRSSSTSLLLQTKETEGAQVSIYSQLQWHINMLDLLHSVLKEKNKNKR